MVYAKIDTGDSLRGFDYGPFRESYGDRPRHTERPRLQTNSRGRPCRRFGQVGRGRQPGQMVETIADWMNRIGWDAREYFPGAVEVFIHEYERGPLVLKVDGQPLTWQGFPMAHERPFADRRYFVTLEEAEWLLFYGLTGWQCGKCRTPRIKPLSPKAVPWAVDVAKRRGWLQSNEHADNPWECPHCRHDDTYRNVN